MPLRFPNKHVDDTELDGSPRRFKKDDDTDTTVRQERFSLGLLGVLIQQRLAKGENLRKEVAAGTRTIRHYRDQWLSTSTERSVTPSPNDGPTASDGTFTPDQIVRKERLISINR